MLFFRKPKLGQAATEYLMVAAFVTAIVIPATYLFYSYASSSAQEIDNAQIDKLGRDVIATAETVYYLGYPSRLEIEGRLPKNIKSISADQDMISKNYVLSFNAEVNGLPVNFTYVTDIKILGTFDQLAPNAGIKKARIYAGPTDSLNPTPYVTINFGDSSCLTGTVSHNTCTPTPGELCYNGAVVPSTRC